MADTINSIMEKLRKAGYNGSLTYLANNPSNQITKAAGVDYNALKAYVMANKGTADGLYSNYRNGQTRSGSLQPPPSSYSGGNQGSATINPIAGASNSLLSQLRGLTAGAGSANAAEHDNPGADQELNQGVAPHAAAKQPAGVPLLGGIFGTLAGLGKGVAAALSSIGAAQAANAGQQPVASLPSLNLPDAPTQHVAARDFTDQANQMAASAYAPRYDALNTGSANAQKQYKMSDAVVAGLYKNLASSDAANQAADQARYDQAGKAAQATGTNLNTSVGQTYDANAQQEAALAKQLGLDPRANVQQITGANTQSKSQAQAIGQQNTAAQVANINSGKQSQSNYDSNVGKADTTQGTVQRENVLNDLNNTLSQYDQQRQDLAGQQASQALDIGQQLTTQDLGVQNSNAGYAQNAYQDALSKAQADYNAQVANQTFQGQQVQQNFDNQQKIASAQAAAAAAQQAQANYQQDYDLNSAKMQGDQALSLAQLREKYGADKVNPTTGLSDDPYLNYSNEDPTSKILTNLTQQTFKGEPDKAKSALDYAAAIAQDPTKNTSQGSYIKAVTDYGVAHGLTFEQAAAAAQAYWAGTGMNGTVTSTVGSNGQITTKQVQ